MRDVNTTLLVAEGSSTWKRNKMRYILSKLFSVSTYRVFTISGFVSFGPKGSKNSRCCPCITWGLCLWSRQRVGFVAPRLVVSVAAVFCVVAVSLLLTDMLHVGYAVPRIEWRGPVGSWCRVPIS